MAASGAVGAAEVAWFPGFVQRAEGVGNGLGGLLGQNGDGIGLEAVPAAFTGFELAIEVFSWPSKMTGDRGVSFVTG